MKNSNSNSRVVSESSVNKTTPEQINYDRQKNSEFNNKTIKKKRGLFNKKKDKKDVSPTSTTSEYLWREVNLFWPETIAIVAAVVAGAILMFLVRFMSASGLELIKDQLTPNAYVEVAGLIQNVNSLFLGVAAIPFLVLIGFFLYRLVNFTPRGDKYLVARVKRTGAIRLSVDKIKDMKLKFQKGMMADEMQISNPRKHWIETTGKPILYLFEGDDSNADLNVMAGNVSSKAKDTNTINDMSFQDGRRFERMNMENKNELLTPTNILLILILVGIGMALFFLLKNPETTAQLMKVPVGFAFGGWF